MKAPLYKIAWAILAAALLCTFIPFEARVESVDLASVYREGMPSGKQLHGGSGMLWLEYKQLVFHIQVTAYMDISRVKQRPKTTLNDHQVATSPMGESGLVTRWNEHPDNLKHGMKTGYPCRLSFRRGNVIAYVFFKEQEKGIHWPEEVNRLTDAEQIALLEEVGRVLDKALIAKAPGVQVIKWSLANTCRLRLQALWDDLENRIIGGGPYH